MYKYRILRYRRNEVSEGWRRISLSTVWLEFFSKQDAMKVAKLARLKDFGIERVLIDKKDRLPDKHRGYVVEKCIKGWTIFETDSVKEWEKENKGHSIRKG